MASSSVLSTHATTTVPSGRTVGCDPWTERRVPSAPPEPKGAP